MWAVMVSVGMILGQNVTYGISSTDAGTRLDCTLSIGLILGE